MFPVQTADVQKIHLANGLTVLGLEYHKLPLVHITAMMRRGSEQDPEGKEGLADLTAEMLSLGTERRNSQQVALEMERLGAQYSASSGWDASLIDLFGLSEDFDALMDVVGDMVLRPTFPPEELQQSQQRRISRLIQQRDQAEVIADEIIVQGLLEHTPYAHPTYGTIPSLGGITVGDPRSFYRHHYSPHDTVLLVIGDLTPEHIRERVEVHLGGWKAARMTEDQPATPMRPRGRKIIVVNRPDLTQSQIRVGLLGITRRDEQYLPFKVMNYIFGGGGFSSRLMQRVRAEKGYTYGISSSFQAGHIAGPFIVSTFTPTATTVPAIEEIVTVMEDFIATGAQPGELEEAKNFFTGSFPLKLETPGQMAKELLKLELYDIPADYLVSYPEAIRKVTVEEVNTLASAYLLPEDILFVVVGRAEAFVDFLRNWGKVELLEYAEVAKGGLLSSASRHASTTRGS
jgi:zinc protease